MLIRHFIFFVFALTTSNVPNARAMSLEIIGKNARSIYRTTLVGDYHTTSVAQFTLNALAEAEAQKQLTYEASELGIQKVNGVGSEEELISDTQMKALGWCYSINGVVPEKFANQVYFTSGTDRVVWFYAYAFYDSGEWVSQCVPAWQPLPSKKNL